MLLMEKSRITERQLIIIISITYCYTTNEMCYFANFLEIASVCVLITLLIYIDITFLDS